MPLFKNLKTLDSFKNSTFRAYYVGMAGQWAAVSMQAVVQSLLVYRLTGSAALLGTVALVSALPMVAGALFTGVLTDRFAKKNLLQVSQVLMALIALAVAICLTIGLVSKEREGSWWVILVAAIFQGALQAISNTARQAIIPELVNKDQIMNAVSLNSMGMQLFQFIAPTIGGLMVDFVGFNAVYFLMAGLCTIAVFLTNAIPTVKPIPSIVKHNMISDVLEGLKYVWNDKKILGIIIFTMICVLITSPMTTLVSVFTEDILKIGGVKVGATGLGILQGMMAVGAFAGSFFFASTSLKKRGLIMLSGGLALGIFQSIFSFSTFWPLSMMMAIFIGMGRIWHYTPAITMIQTYSDQAYLGRVFSIVTLGWGLGNIMAFINGLVAESVGVQWSVGGSSLLLVFIAGIMLIFFPKVRKLN